MRVVRFETEGRADSRWGILEGEHLLPVAFPTLHRRDEAPVARAQCRFLAPAVPSKIVCVGRNYRDHIREMGHERQDLPVEPGLFLKGPNALADPDEAIPYPDFSRSFHFEGELAAVVGQRMSRVTEAEALRGIVGYTAALDLTARDCQRSDLQWTRAKSADRFCPLGPWLETELNPARTVVRTRVNGEIRQEAGTDLMIFSMGCILSYVSSFMTLEPGDVVLTGTPEGVGPLERGDRVEVSVDGVGTLGVRIV